MFGYGVPNITSFVGDGFQECVDCARKRYPDRDSELFTSGIEEDDYRPVFDYQDDGYPWSCECGYLSPAYERTHDEVAAAARKGVEATELGDLDDADELGHGNAAVLIAAAVEDAVAAWLEEGNSIESYGSSAHRYGVDDERLEHLGRVHGTGRLVTFLDDWAAEIQAAESATYDGDLFTQSV